MVAIYSHGSGTEMPTSPVPALGTSSCPPLLLPSCRSYNNTEKDRGHLVSVSPNPIPPLLSSAGASAGAGRSGCDGRGERAHSGAGEEPVSVGTGWGRGSAAGCWVRAEMIFSMARACIIQERGWAVPWCRTVWVRDGEIQWGGSAALL